MGCDIRQGNSLLFQHGCGFSSAAALSAVVGWSVVHGSHAQPAGRDCHWLGAVKRFLNVDQSLEASTRSLSTPALSPPENLPTHDVSFFAPLPQFLGVGPSLGALHRASCLVTWFRLEKPTCMHMLCIVPRTAPSITFGMCARLEVPCSRPCTHTCNKEIRDDKYSHVCCFVKGLQSVSLTGSWDGIMACHQMHDVSWSTSARLWVDRDCVACCLECVLGSTNLCCRRVSTWGGPTASRRRGFCNLHATCCQYIKQPSLTRPNKVLFEQGPIKSIRNLRRQHLLWDPRPPNVQSPRSSSFRRGPINADQSRDAAVNAGCALIAVDAGCALEECTYICRLRNTYADYGTTKLVSALFGCNRDQRWVVFGGSCLLATHEAAIGFICTLAASRPEGEEGWLVVSLKHGRRLILGEGRG